MCPPWSGGGVEQVQKGPYHWLLLLFCGLFNLFHCGIKVEGNEIIWFTTCVNKRLNSLPNKLDVECKYGNDVSPLYAFRTCRNIYCKVWEYMKCFPPAVLISDNCILFFLSRIVPHFSVNVYLRLYLKTTKLPEQRRLNLIGTSEGLKIYKYTKIEIHQSRSNASHSRFPSKNRPPSCCFKWANVY